MKQSRLRDLKRNNVICTMVVFVFSAMIATSLHAMEPTNQLIPRIPMDVFSDGMLQAIVTQEKVSAKHLRYDLHNLSSVNKSLNSLVKNRLNELSFNEFIINTLSKNNIFGGNKIAIAAHLGTLPSVALIKEYVELENKEKSDQKKIELRNILIDIELRNILIDMDEIEDKCYMPKAQVLLWNILTFLNLNIFDFNNQQEVPYIKISDAGYEETHYFKRLKNNTQVTKNMFSLLLTNGFIPQSKEKKITPLMMCCISKRDDLAPIAYQQYPDMLNAQDDKGNTALMHAILIPLIEEGDEGIATYSNMKTIDFLLSKKINLEIRNVENQRAIDIAHMIRKDAPLTSALIIEKLKEAHDKQLNELLKKANDNETV